MIDPFRLGSCSVDVDHDRGRIENRPNRVCARTLQPAWKSRRAGVTATAVAADPLLPFRCEQSNRSRDDHRGESGN